MMTKQLRLLGMDAALTLGVKSFPGVKMLCGSNARLKTRMMFTVSV